MPVKNARRESARKALFSGGLDVEGMDDVLALYRDLFNMADKNPSVKSNVGLREMTGEESELRLSEGFTLVDLESLLPAPEELTARFVQVVEVLAAHSEDADTLKSDMANLSAEPERLTGLARTFLAEGEEILRKELLTIDGVNPEVVMFALFNALKGYFLQAAARCQTIDTSAWEEGYCPVCGGEGAVSYNMGEGGRRYLICFRCETHWRSKRLTCPYCGHEDPNESGYLFSEDADYRTLSASVCSECRSYIKAWRIEGDDLGDIHPEMDDLKTPGFDRAVEEAGYSRGAPNIYGVWIGTVTDEEGDRDDADPDSTP